MNLAKKNIRLFSLLSLVFLTQCCCIVLPLQAQAQQEVSIFAEIANQVERVLPTLSIAAEWANDVQHLVLK